MWSAAPRSGAWGSRQTRRAASEATPPDHREAELRVVGPGLDELVGVGLDARRHPDQHAGPVAARRPASWSSRSSSSEESATIRPTSASSAWSSSSTDLLLPWNDDPLGREAGLQRDVQLASGRDVEVETLLVDEAGHRGAQEGLARIGHVPVAEAGDVVRAAALGCRPRRRRTAACRIARRATPKRSASRSPAARARRRRRVTRRFARRRRSRHRRAEPSPRAPTLRGARARRRARSGTPPPATVAPG